MKIEITDHETALSANAAEIVENIYQREDGTLVILDTDGHQAIMILTTPKR